MTSTPFSDAPAGQATAGCRVLGAQDTGDAVWGHISVRDPEGRGFWMKAGPGGFDEVTERDVVLVSFGGERLAGEHQVPIEYPLHSEVLRARADVNSVVHTHQPYAIALSAADRELYVFSNAAGPFAEGVPRYERPVGLIDTIELGAELATALASARALFLTGHGVVTVGATVGAAVVTSILLERACRLQILAAAAGGVASELQHPGARYKHTESDRYMQRTWEYLLRQVSATGA